MVSGILAYRFVPVDPVRKTVPVRQSTATPVDNGKIARWARYDTLRMHTYAPYRSMRNKKTQLTKQNNLSTSGYIISRRLDTYA